MSFVVMYFATASPVVLVVQGFLAMWLVIRTVVLLAPRRDARAVPEPESTGSGWI